MAWDSFLACGCPVILAPIIEKTTFSQLNYVFTSVKISVDRGYVGKFGGVHSILFIYVPVLSPIPYGLDQFAL